MLNIQSLSLTPDRKKELTNYLLSTFWASVRARSEQVDSRYRRWLENYSAKPKEETRTTPFYNASNFVPQLIRMNTDIMHARLMGLLFAPKPFWRPHYFVNNGVVSYKHTEALAEFYDSLAFNAIKLFEPVDLTLHTTTKVGTGVLKAPWIQDSYWIGGGKLEGGVEGKEIKTEGLKLFSVDYDDFWAWPITSQCIADCEIVFHRVRLTREEVEFRKASPLYSWDSAACETLLTTPDQPSSSPAREAEARSAGVTLTTDVSRPFNVVEAWLRYSITNEPSKRYCIICTFNPIGIAETALLRGIYNYYPTGTNPFIDFRLNHRAGLFHGVGFAELLEQAQEEQAQIHNSRRDANTIVNVPGWKKKKYAGIPNPATEWYPGKVFELENMDDMEPLVFGVSYNSMIEEESYLLQLAERYTGVTAPMQGAGTGSLSGKRGIYNTGGTLALIAEGNRRIDLYTKRLRYPFHRLGSLIFQSYRDFRPNGPELEAMGSTGQLVKELFKLRESPDFPHLFFDIGASDGSANKETDRTALLLMANTMASYYRQVVEAASVISQIPDPNHPLAKILLSVLDGARDLANRLLSVYDVGDRKSLLVDVRELMGGSPEAGAEAASSRGMPATEEDVSGGELQSLSTRLAALQSQGVM